MTTCPACGGSGWRYSKSNYCNACRGLGLLEDNFIREPEKPKANPVRIIIGEYPDGGDGVFKIIGASGRDITDELSVESVHIEAKAFERTRATIVVYCEAEVAIRSEVIKLHAKLCAEGTSMEVGGE